jgi:hypothetical protein
VQLDGRTRLHTCEPLDPEGIEIEWWRLPGGEIGKDLTGDRANTESMAGETGRHDQPLDASVR